MAYTNRMSAIRPATPRKIGTPRPSGRGVRQFGQRFACGGNGCIQRRQRTSFDKALWGRFTLPTTIAPAVLASRSAEPADAHREVPPFVAEELQILRRADHIVHRRRIALIRQIVDADPQRQPLPAEREAPLDMEV